MNTLSQPQFKPAIIHSIIWICMAFTCSACSPPPSKTIKLSTTPVEKSKVQLEKQSKTNTTAHEKKQRKFDCGGSVFFSEVMLDPDAAEDKFGEFIEMVNLSNREIQLEGWKIRNNKAEEILLKSHLIKSGGTFVIGPTNDHDINGEVNLDDTWRKFSLPNRRGLVHLLDPCGKSVDRVRYAENPPWPKRRSGVSMERRQLNTLNNQPHRLWKLSRTRRVTGDFGSPGTIEARVLRKLREEHAEIMSDDVNLRSEGGWFNRQIAPIQRGFQNRLDFGDSRRTDMSSIR